MQSDVEIRIDRVQGVSDAPPGHKPPIIRGFDVVRDTWVSRQTEIDTYRRCREYHSFDDAARIYWQYERLQPFLMPWKVSIIGDDRTGLTRKQIEVAIEHCHKFRFITVELAFDFRPGLGVDRAFAKRHAIFGKSRRQF